MHKILISFIIFYLFSYTHCQSSASPASSTIKENLDTEAAAVLKIFNEKIKAKDATQMKMLAQAWKIIGDVEMTIDEKLDYVKENILKPRGVTKPDDNELYKEVQLFAKVFQYFNETYYTKSIGTGMDQPLIDLIGVITRLQKYTSLSTQEELQAIQGAYISLDEKQMGVLLDIWNDLKAKYAEIAEEQGPPSDR